jgi:hypothetical protein
MADPFKPTIDDLIAWGLDYEALIKEPIPPGGFHLPRPMLDHYIAAANAALVQQREQARKKPRSRGGRPRGGMGEQRMRLVASGAREEDADRIVAQQNRRPVKSVERAVKRVSKNPPR